MTDWLVDTSALVRRGRAADGQMWADRIERGLDPYLAPSLVDLQDRIATAYEDDPASITELVVDETGTVLRVGFDPSPTTDDDEVAYQVFAEVDSPGDPIDQER